MKCKYIGMCPSRSGWCLAQQPSSQCEKHIKAAIDNLQEQLDQAKYVYEKLQRADCANLPVW